MADAQQLAALENILLEFFSSTTSNERKHEIEQVLLAFTRAPSAWQQCLFFLTNTQSEYVMMYCLTVLESVISRQWQHLQQDERMQLRISFNQLLLSQHERVPSFIRNKLIKLVVDIGRSDWPHSYPDFLSSIVQLIQHPDTTILGLLLLQTTSEELACPRDDLSVARKEELYKLLLIQVPSLLNLLNGLLASQLEKHQTIISATPPPSPTQPRNNAGLDVDEQAGSSMMQRLFQPPNGAVSVQCNPTLNAQAVEVASCVLSCLAHLFSWIPLSSTISPTLLNNIFQYAVFGSADHASASATGRGVGSTLGSLAMTCINELLAKNYVPQEFEDYLLLMFQQTFHLLRRFTKDTSTTSRCSRLSELDDSYVDKFTEFLRLFVGIHLPRFESNVNFPVAEFLQLLMKYTFKQPSNDGFFACLDIWNSCLEYLTGKVSTRVADNTAVLLRHQEAVRALLTELMHKFQFRYNQSELDALDYETVDNDTGETEWQQYLCQCLETVARISDLLPEYTLQVLFQSLEEYLEVYVGLERFIETTSEGRRLVIAVENDCRKLHCTLRDLSSMFQAIGRMSHHFLDNKFLDKFNDGLMLVRRLTHGATYASRLQLHEVHSVADTVLHADFLEVHAQTLAALKAYSGWLSQYYLDCLQPGPKQAECQQLLIALLNNVTPLFKGVPAKISQAAVQLLVSLLVSVRAACFLDQPSLLQLYNLVASGAFSHLNKQTYVLLCRALSHYLVLPWPGCKDADQNWALRTTSHAAFTRQLFADYLSVGQQLVAMQNVQPQTTAAANKLLIVKTLSLLTDLVESIGVEGVSRSRKIYHESLSDIIHLTLRLFPSFIHQPDLADYMMSLFLALFEGLLTEMGVSFMEQIVMTFMNLFTRDQLAELLISENQAAIKVLEKFIKILEIIVRQPGAAFKAYLSKVLTIATELIYPLIAQRSSPDIKPALYTLLTVLLQNNWRYFFNVSLMSSVDGSQMVDNMENTAQFMKIMEAFGQSFLQPDIDVFRQNLESLENLNNKWKLYSKKVFRDLMLFQFINVLLQTLIAKSHDLLREEIVSVIYNMVSVDFAAFHKSFLPSFVDSVDSLSVQQKTLLLSNFSTANDLPSFVQNVNRLVIDTRWFVHVNSVSSDGFKL